MSGRHQVCGLAGCRVRETLDFAARVQGVGVKKAELESLLAKSGSGNAPSDAEVDAFLSACTDSSAMSSLCYPLLSMLRSQCGHCWPTLQLVSATCQEHHVYLTQNTVAEHSH